MPDASNKPRKKLRSRALLGTLIMVGALFGGWLFHAKTQRDLNMKLLGAVRKGNTEVARQLILRGSDPNIRDVPEHQPSLWHQIRYAFDHNSGNNEIDDQKQTLLELAFDSEHENIEMTKTLLDAGARADDSSHAHVTPLMTAVFFDQLQTVRTLIDHGANPLARDDSGQLPIQFLALDHGSQVEVVELLVNHGTDVNSTYSDGTTVLMHGLHIGIDVSVVRFLVAHGANVNARSKNGNSALLAATKFGDARTTLQLLEYGAQVNVCDQEKFMPLHLALSKPSLPVIKALLARGAKIDTINKYGDTPLTICVRDGGRPDIVKVLIEHGANVNYRDQDGVTVLAMAKSTHDDKTTRLLEAAGARR